MTIDEVAGGVDVEALAEVEGVAVEADGLLIDLKIGGDSVEETEAGAATAASGAEGVASEVAAAAGTSTAPSSKTTNPALVCVKSAGTTTS